MTVHCWGEKAEGEWTLEIQDMPSQVRNPEKQGQWLSGISHNTSYLTLLFTPDFYLNVVSLVILFFFFNGGTIHHGNPF